MVGRLLVEDDSSRVRCHVCGRWWAVLGIRSPAVTACRRISTASSQRPAQPVDESATRLGHGSPDVRPAVFFDHAEPRPVVPDTRDPAS
jgi:hypothetical protein